MGGKISCTTLPPSDNTARARTPCLLLSMRPLTLPTPCTPDHMNPRPALSCTCPLSGGRSGGVYCVRRRHALHRGEGVRSLRLLPLPVCRNACSALHKLPQYLLSLCTRDQGSVKRDLVHLEKRTAIIGERLPLVPLRTKHKFLRRPGSADTWDGRCLCHTSF